MAALLTTNPTLTDLAMMRDPNGQIAKVVEVLTQRTEMLEDMTWQEGNLPTGNVTSIRTGLPPVTWRKMYGGVQPGKGTQTRVTDTCGMLEAFAESDKALADLSGDLAGFLMNEERAQIQAMNQEIQRTLIYGNEGTNDATFTGFMARFNSLSAVNAQNILNTGSVTNTNASILLVYWSPETCFGIVPKGSIAGLQREFMGRMVIESQDGVGGRMVGYRTHYRWDAGLTVRDWRAVVRICNIDKPTLTATGTTGANLPDQMFKALEVVPQSAAIGRPVFYMNRVTATALRQQVSNRTAGSTLDYMDVGGKKIMAFQGVPIRRVDCMSADEFPVT